MPTTARLVKATEVEIHDLIFVPTGDGVASVTYVDETEGDEVVLTWISGENTGQEWLARSEHVAIVRPG